MDYEGGSPQAFVPQRLPRRTPSDLGKQDAPPPQEQQQQEVEQWDSDSGGVAPAPNLCSRCEEEAFLRCINCETILCEECSHELHSKGKWQTHVIEPLDAQEASYLDKFVMSEEEVMSPKLRLSWGVSVSAQNNRTLREDRLGKARSIKMDPAFLEDFNAAVDKENQQQAQYQQAQEQAQYQQAQEQAQYQQGQQGQQGQYEQYEGVQQGGQSQPGQGYQGQEENGVSGGQSPASVHRGVAPGSHISDSPNSPSQRGRARGSSMRGAPVGRGTGTRSFPPQQVQPPAGRASPVPVKRAGAVSVSALKSKIGDNILAGFKPQASPAFTVEHVQARKAQAQKEQVREKVNKTSGRLLVLSISIPDREILEDKIFSPVFSVLQVAKFVYQNVLNEALPDKKEKGKAYYCPQAKGVLMDEERTLQSYGLTNQDTLEFVPITHEPYLLRANIQGAQDTYITLKIHEATSVWSVTQQILKKLHARTPEWSMPFPPDHYGLFFGDSEPLDELEMMFTYKHLFEQKLVLRKKEVQPTNPDLKIAIIYNDFVYLDVESTSTVNSLLRTFIRSHALKSAPLNSNDYFLQIPPGEEDDDTGVWLELSRTLDTYEDLRQHGIVEFRKFRNEFLVEMPDGIVYSVAFPEIATARDCIEMLVHNCPDLTQHISRSELTLCTPEGNVISLDRSLWSYGFGSAPIQVKRQLHQLVVFMGDHGQRTINVDYSVPVQKTVQQIWSSFGMTFRKNSDFSMLRLSPSVSVDLSKSFTAQSVPYNSAVIIKLKEVEKKDMGPEDINIWDEPENANTVSFQGTSKKMEAGTFNKLVTVLTSAQNYDIEFMKAFLLTYLSFSTPQKLLEKLIERYHVPMPNGATQEEIEKWQQNVQRPIQLRVCNTLKHWMDNHWQDFDHELTQQVVTFVDNFPVEGHNAIANQLRQAILKRTYGIRTNTVKANNGLTDCPESILKVPKKKTLNGIPLNLFDFDELEVARQLTLIEFNYYEKILPNELMAQRWARSKAAAESPNVLAMIRRSTVLSHWVSFLILEPARVKLRSKRFAHLIRVAAHLRSLNNFSTLMAFLAGFNSSAVSRLRFTKHLFSKKTVETLAELENLMSVDLSYKMYRAALHQSNPPCIPYLGTYLTDLTFMDEGNPDFINSLINMGKHVLIYKVIAEIQRFQQVGYNLKSAQMIAKHLRDLPEQDEKAAESSLYELSLSREPRGAEKVL